MPANISEDIWDIVSTALLKRQQLKVQYQSRGQEQTNERILHPAGLISRHTVSYLVASVDNYQDLRQFALHRMHSAQCVDLPAKEPINFNIDTYIREQLNTSEAIKPITLRAAIAPSIAWLLGETPISEDQHLNQDAHSDWYELTATVPNDSETLWWVFSLGEKVIVHEPQAWREDIIARHKKAVEQYQ